MDLSKLDLSTIPALTPPPGVTPNFKNPENFFGTIIGTIVVCLTLTTFLAWTRIYTRLFITKSVGWDDYAYFIGWLGLIGYCVLGAVGMQYGNGVHQWDVNIPDAINFGKLANTEEVYYTILVFMTKLAILLQYLRIFVPNKRSKTYYFTQFLIWSNFIIYLVLGFCAAFMCIPREKIWNPLAPGRCRVSLAGLLIAGGIVNIFSDFCVLALPLTTIWGLQMATKHKIGISAVFAVGLFACVSSIMRLVTSIEAIRSKDNTWDLVRTYLWTVAEITSGVVCGSLPILPQFMRSFVPKLTSIFASNSNRKGTSQITPSNRLYHAESRNTSKKPGSGAWHDLRDMNLKAPYVEFDRSDNRSDTVVLAPEGAAPAVPEETKKANTAGTPPEKGGGVVWDGPVVHQTDLESGVGISDWQSKRGPH